MTRKNDKGLADDPLPLFPSLMDGASAAVIQFDHEGRVQLWNHAAEKLFGWRAEEVLGKPSPMVPNDLWEDNQSWFLRCLGGQTMSGIQMQRRRKDDTRINLHAWAWPVRSEQGRIIGVMMMFFPLGERALCSTLTADQYLKRQTEQAQRFHAALLGLTKTDHPDLNAALEAYTTVASQTLQVERVSIWLFSPHRQAIQCICQYHSSPKKFDAGQVLTADEYPRYFETLEQSRSIAAGTARQDPRTSEFTDSYLEPFGITSMLDVPIRLHGKEIGIVCHEHVGTEREWTLEEQAFAGTIADLVSLSFENQEHAKAERALKESQATLHSFVESTSSCMAVLTLTQDGDLQFNWANAALIRLWPQVNKLETWSTLSELPLTKPFVERLKKHAQEVIEEKRSVRVELLEDQTNRWLEISLAPIHANGHMLPRLSLTMDDKTELHQAIEKLHTSEQLLSAVINGSPLGIQVFDQKGTLCRQNPAMVQLSDRLHLNGQIGQYNILEPEKALSADDITMARRAMTGEIVENPHRLIHEKNHHPTSSQKAEDNEAQMVLDTIYYPVKGQDNSTSGIACFHRDVSERKRLEEQLQQTQRLESLGLLAGTIAHDFNGLLTAIYGFIDLAQNELPAHHPARSYLQSSLQASLRATDLTQQLLAYAGKGKREIKQFDLSVLVLEVTEILRSMINQRGILQMDLSPTLPDITADMTQIRQVVMNLISNAAEALTQRTGKVYLKTGQARLDANDLSACQVKANDVEPGNFVFMEVRDEGTGISPDIQQRIFDPFFTTKTQGRGLGLAAVIGIVRGHKAAMKLVSQPGNGSTFTVYLPAIST